MFECEDGRSRSRSTLTADVVISNADNVSVEKPSYTQILQINKSTAAVE